MDQNTKMNQITKMDHTLKIDQNTKIDQQKCIIFLHFRLTFFHSKCNRSSLRSHYERKLFLWFWNTVHLRNWVISAWMYIRYYILKPFTTLSSPIKILAWLEVCKNVMEFHKSHKLTLRALTFVGSFFRLALRSYGIGMKRWRLWTIRSLHLDMK